MYEQKRGGRKMKKVTIHTMKIFVLGLAVLALGACSSAPTIMYSGPVLPADQTAVVGRGTHTDIVSVDGARVSGAKVVVLSGKHTIEMKPTDGDYSYYGPGNYIFYSRVTGRADLTAEPGHVYEVYAHMIAEPSAREYGVGDSTGSGFKWSGYVIDKTTSKKVAETGWLRLEAEPRSDSGGWNISN
jgi:hypothetical protein